MHRFLEKNYFRLISSAATRERDKFFILNNISDKIDFKDVTDDYCCLGLFGPKSRDLLSEISKDDYSNKSFKFGTGKYVKINNIKVWAQRLSYVGEVGFEMYVENSNAKKLYEIIVFNGKKHNLTHCGMHALDTMRMESGFYTGDTIFLQRKINMRPA